MAAQSQLSSLASPPRPVSTAERSLWQVLWQRKFLFFLGSLGGPGLALLYYLTCTPVFQSSAQVLVVKRRLDPTAGLETRQGPVEDYVSTQRELMKSPLIVRRVLRKLGPDTLVTISTSEQNDPTEVILKRLTVTRAKDPAGGPSNVVTLSYRGEGAGECNALLTAVIDSYREFLDETYVRVSADSVALLSRASSALKEELAKKEAAYLVFLQQRPASGKAKEGSSVRQERLNSVETKRTTLLVRLTEVEGQLAALQKAMKEGRSRESLLAMVDSVAGKLESDGPRTSQSQILREHLLPLLLQEQKLLEKFGPEHPEVEGLRKRIEATRAAAARALPGAGLGEGLTRPGQAGGGSDPVQGWLDFLTQEVDRLRTSERLLAGLAEREQGEATKLSAAEFQDEVFRNDITRTRQLYESENKRLEDARLSREFGGYEAQVIAPPGSGGVKQVAPSLSLTLAAALVLGFLGGLGMVFLAEALDKSFRTPEEVSRSLGLPVLGQIPFLSRRGKPVPPPGQPALAPILYAHHRSASAEAEANRAVHAVLSCTLRDGGPQVIQITSPAARDGTTAVAANLAIAAAQSGRRVAVVDANLRSPGLGSLFGLPDGPGLSSFLEGTAEAEDMLQPCSIPGLFVLPSGPLSQNPSELLGSARFRGLIQFLRQHYDLVLLDTPPLLAVADPCAVAASVDGILLTLRVPGTTRPRAEQARELLRAVAAPVLGVVVNQVRRRGGYRGHRYTPYGRAKEKNHPRAAAEPAAAADECLSIPCRLPAVSADKDVCPTTPQTNNTP